MKKTKILSVLLASTMLAGMTVGLTSCGKEVTDGVKIDKNKYQINAFAVENGVGHQWLVQAAIKWNEMNPDSKFQVIPQTGSMSLHSGLDAMVEAKTTDINMYFYMMVHQKVVHYYTNKNLNMYQEVKVVL